MKQEKQILVLKLLLGLVFMINWSLIDLQAQNINYDWAKGVGGTGADQGRAVVVDAWGSVYTTGSFEGTVDFDPSAGVTTLTASGKDIFILKLDSLGNLIWVKSIGGTSADIGNSIAVDATGNVYTTGSFGGTVDFDPGVGVTNLVAGGQNDVFVCKLDSSGAYIWAKKMGGASSDIGYAIAVDGGGNVFTTGTFLGTADFDPGVGVTNLVPVGSSDIFVSKLNSVGDFVWVKEIGGSSADEVRALALDGSGNIYLTGYFYSTCDFAPGATTVNLTSLGGTDIFVCKLNSSGNYSWARAMGGTNADVSYSIAVDGSGNVYTTGYFLGTSDFDPNSGTSNLTSAGFDNIFISKLNASGVFVWAKRIGGASGAAAYALTLDGTANVYLTGYYGGTTDFDPGAGVANISGSGMFVCKLNSSGIYVWVKKLGGNSSDKGYGVKVDNAGSVYTTGFFNGTNDFDPNAGVATLTSVGLGDIFVHKMSLCFTPTAPINTTSASNQTICSNTNTILSASGNGTLGWYSALTGGIYLGSGANYTTGNLTATTNFYVQDSTCTNSSRTLIIVSVVSMIPSITSQSNVVCYGESNAASTVAISGGGVFSYIWNDLSATTNATITGLVAGVYVCTITDANSCTATQGVTITEPAAIDVSTLVNGYTLFANQNGATYQWLDCNNNLAINGEVNQSFTPSMNGDYAVIVTIGACADTSTCTNVTGVGFKELKLPKVALYPNPTSSILTIEFEASFSNLSVEITNALGQIVVEKEITNKISNIILPSLTGIYFVKVRSGSLMQIYKIIKE